jgi:hypothetical protein
MIIRLIRVLFWEGFLLGGALPGGAAETALPSPENHVFQYMTRQSFTVPGFKPSNTAGYLWIPPACQRVRGLLVMSDNVPEQGLAGSPVIRAVCAEQDLAILFFCPSFRISDVCADKQMSWPEKGKYHGAYLQQCLEALATESGYAELRTVPLLPMGESMSLQVVNLLTLEFPDRCIAGIWIKDAPMGFARPGLPMLAACGTAAEWEQQTFDIFTRWQQMATNDAKDAVNTRTAKPDWPGSLLVEAGSAHFSCTRPMVDLIAQYIRAAAKARLPANGGAALRPVDLNSGQVAGLPVPGATPVKPKPYTACTPAERTLPWYFDHALAQAAYDLANVNWNAQTQVPVFTDKDGKPLPFNGRGIFNIPCSLEPDGISFSVNATFLDKLPAEFVKGGTPLTHVAGAPAVEWLKGPAIPLGNNRFQIALDRSASPNGDLAFIFRTWHPGDANFRLSVNPGMINIPRNKTGKPQAIAFDAIPDQPAGVPEIQLHATSDSDLPVKFFVRAGPAEIHGDKLVFTPIPPRSKMPITVTVGAWQWGRAAEPAIQTATLVERTFKIGK